MIAGIKDSKVIALAICEAIGIDANFVQRIILDLQVEDVVKVYVQMMGDEQLLDIDWTAALDGGEVVRELDSPAPEGYGFAVEELLGKNED